MRCRETSASDVSFLQKGSSNNSLAMVSAVKVKWTNAGSVAADVQQTDTDKCQRSFIDKIADRDIAYNTRRALSQKPAAVSRIQTTLSKELLP